MARTWLWGLCVCLELSLTQASSSQHCQFVGPNDMQLSEKALCGPSTATLSASHAADAAHLYAPVLHLHPLEAYRLTGVFVLCTRLQTHGSHTQTHSTHTRVHAQIGCTISLRHFPLNIKHTDPALYYQEASLYSQNHRQLNASAKAGASPLTYLTVLGHPRQDALLAGVCSVCCVRVCASFKLGLPQKRRD